MHFAVLLIYNGKIIFGESDLKRIDQNTYLIKVTGVNICRKATLSNLDVLSNNTKIVNCNQRLSLSLYKELCNVFKRECKA